MGITETTDAALNQLVQAHPKALVMLTTVPCATCDLLRPLFEAFATNQAYAGIAFLRLRAGENPAARPWLNQLHAPYFVAYCQGRVLHGEALSTEQQVRALLNALLTHL